MSAVSTAAPRDAAEANNQREEPSAALRVFISHSSADNEFGLRLAKRLQEALGGTPSTVWYDAYGDPDTAYQSGLLGGDDWWKRIEHELTTRSVFVVILSPEAMQSKWVEEEIGIARMQKNAVGGGKVIVPVLHSPCEVPRSLARIQFVSFLPPRPFDEAFAELVAAVQLGESRIVEDLDSVALGPPFDEALLPVPDHFVGRKEDVEALVNRLGREQEPITVCLNGMGGLGKTSLAAVVLRNLRAQNRYPDGIAVVDCREIGDSIEVLRQVLGRFDTLRRLPGATEIAKLNTMAQNQFKDKRALVVLDNIDPELGEKLAPAMTSLRGATLNLLLISRQVLPLAVAPREADYKLPLLGSEDALELFLQSMGGMRLSELPSQQLEAAQRIVAALGNHTLAVKLAGGYVAEQQRELTDLAEELESNPRRALVLQDGDEAVKAVLVPSYRILPDSAQRLFVALAAFAGTDIGRNAVLAVGRALDLTDIDESIVRIVRLRLVDAAMNSDMPQGSDRVRLQLHLLVHAFAFELFSDWSEEQRDLTVRAITRFYIDYVAEPINMQMAPPAALLGPDERNIEGALDSTYARRDPTVAAALCFRMQYFWYEAQIAANSLAFLHRGEVAAWTVFARTRERDDLKRAVRLSRTYNAALIRPPSSMTGRKDDIAWIMARLREGGIAVPITALRGLGGIGKTALAGAAVRQALWEDRFVDGIAVVLCAGLTEPDEILRQVVGRLDPVHVLTQGSASGLISDVTDLLLGKQVLIILDNLESELDARRVIEPLRGAGGTLLMTARHHLPASLVGAQDSRVLNLPTKKEAVDQFTQELEQRGHLPLSASEMQVAARIVDMLERLPLAIKLAAALAADQHAPLEKVARRFSEALDTSEELQTVPAPQSIYRVFADSFQALPQDARRLFVACAAFATPEFGRNAVLALAAGLGLPEPDRALDLLLRRAFLDADDLDIGTVYEADWDRLYLHDLLHAFAERIFSSWPSEEREAAFEAIAAYYVDYAERVPVAALAVERANVIGVLEWSRTRGDDDLSNRLSEKLGALEAGDLSQWHNSADVESGRI